jgi:hypothetical protein
MFKSSIISSEVAGRSGITGRMKVRRQRRISPPSGSCTTGSDASDASAFASPRESIILCITSLKIGELLVMKDFRTRK